jgi:hypothetical protein
MPIVHIDVTQGSASKETKRTLVAKITKAVDEAYPVPVQSSKRPELGGRGRIPGSTFASTRQKIWHTTADSKSSLKLSGRFCTLTHLPA